MNKKILIAVIAVIIVVVCAVVGYFIIQGQQKAGLRLSVGNYIEYEYNFTGTYVGEMEGTIRAEVTKVDGDNYTVRVDYSPTDGSDAWTETFSCLLGEDFMCPLTMMWEAEQVANRKYEASVFTYSPDGGVGHLAVQFFKEDGTFLGTIGATGFSGTPDPIGVWAKQTFTFDRSSILASATKIRLVMVWLIPVQDTENTQRTATTVFFDDAYFGFEVPELNLAPDPSFESGTGTEPDGWEAPPQGLAPEDWTPRPHYLFAWNTTFGRTDNSSIMISSNDTIGTGWKSDFIPIELDETVLTKVGRVRIAYYTTGIDDAIFVHKESKILVLRTLNSQTVMEVTDTNIEWLTVD